MPKKPAGPAISFPKIPAAGAGAAGAPAFTPTAPSNKYQIGQIITLANGQKALIQNFGRRKKIKV